MLILRAYKSFSRAKALGCERVRIDDVLRLALIKKGAHALGKEVTRP